MGQLHFALFYGTPSLGNAKATALHAQNRFSVTRQLAYSNDQTRRALDIGLFINGLPVATFELKNSLTKQTVFDAIMQYKRTVTRVKSSLSLGAAWCTSPSMTAKCRCAPN
jgi:type I restriction enzyme R subunit